MTREAALKAVMKLPPQERWELVMDVCDTLENVEDLPISDELAEELDRRWAAYQADPSSARPAEEVLRELENEL